MSKKFEVYVSWTVENTIPLTAETEEEAKELALTLLTNGNWSGGNSSGFGFVDGQKVEGVSIIENEELDAIIEENDANVQELRDDDAL